MQFWQKSTFSQKHRSSLDHLATRPHQVVAPVEAWECSGVSDT